jgi:acetolactate decarboxylase
MALDAPLVAAATLRRSRGVDPRSCSTADTTHQLQLAHVLLDGGYAGVATLAEALEGGDHGLGTVDRLDGELVIVDGEPWRVDWHGDAEIMPPETLTPFVVVSTMQSPRTARLRDVSRAGVIAAIADLTDDPGAVVSVRLEGAFDQVLVRSVPPQSPPYRPYVEVCATDEVRWEHRPFAGVFVGFSFPDLSGTATIPGLHLHGLNRLRTTGGHCHDLHVRDAVLSVGLSHDVVMHLPDRSMVDLLETPGEVRAVQRALLRGGGMTIPMLAAALAADPAEVTARLEWLADRGYVAPEPAPPTAADPEPIWRTTLRAPASRASGRVADLLDSL